MGATRLLCPHFGYFHNGILEEPNGFSTAHLKEQLFFIIWRGLRKFIRESRNLPVLLHYLHLHGFGL